MLCRTGQYFLLYSFLGWLLEGCFNCITTGTFQKPNFLHGPYKPMYGFGGILLAASYQYDRRHFAWHCCLLPLAVEFGSGWWLKRHYGLTYWNYSREFLQLGGLICLKFALCWIALAQLVVHCVQPLLTRLVRLTGRLSVWPALFRLFALDCAVTMGKRRQDHLRRTMLCTQNHS